MLDQEDHTEIYDETYWNTQDPGWYGRVSESLRLVLLANELLKARVEHLEILDFGCGFGGFVEIGRKLQMNVWGTDIIPPKVAVEYFLPSVGDRKFDLITACEVIEHLPFPAETFATIKSYLKSPGAFAFQTAQWDPDNLDRDWWYLGPANGHISLFSREALDTMYTQLGASDRRDWRGYPGVQAWLFE
jgi:2-polyprenyl-3-methyl-5-hydroxy-6-metoxy-1,4-benzoquinol methylase